MTTARAVRRDRAVRHDRSADDPHAIVNPIILVEVLSDSTEAYDRGRKFTYYRSIPSLREYVLVSQREPRIEVHHRNQAGRWELYEAELAGLVELPSLRIRLAVDDVYRDPLAHPAERT